MLSNLRVQCQLKAGRSYRKPNDGAGQHRIPGGKCPDRAGKAVPITARDREGHCQHGRTNLGMENLVSAPCRRQNDASALVNAVDQTD